MLTIAIPKERQNYEHRVAATPETVKKFIELGYTVVVEHDAGEHCSYNDKAYEQAGAHIGQNYQQTVSKADIVLKVQRPLTAAEGVDELADIPQQALLIGTLSPYQNSALLQEYANRHIDALSLELLPRITRAQSMDVLSSQTNLAGYRAVIEAAHAFDRAFPMMMTAAGTIAPARVLILGAGVAGLQAIATAKRLGAIVAAFDVRDAAKEQVESLGATFISVHKTSAGDDGKGYAQKMDMEYQVRQADRIQEALKNHDIVITTAQIPGMNAPILIKESMLSVMKHGSIIVDLAVESGGNCEVSKLGETVIHNGVKIIGIPNMPSRIARDASALYAKNLWNFLNLLIDKDSKRPQLNFDDPIIKGVTLTHNKSIIHEAFQN